jgi:hypothetical protein
MEEVHEYCQRVLPERDREGLALRESLRLSHDQITRVTHPLGAHRAE